VESATPPPRFSWPPYSSSERQPRHLVGPGATGTHLEYGHEEEEKRSEASSDLVSPDFTVGARWRPHGEPECARLARNVALCLVQVALPPGYLAVWPNYPGQPA
jgi:hypothetical protein